ncbi:hypothetical protein [Halomonas elongata]|uniref:hypothetical protein n=1 Tax=Halomonas elongata TaxID=2746 RepID=UPI0021F135B0|nr:hypothetical protein [Halomonas elongata]
MAQAEPFGIGLEILVVDQDASTPAADRRDVAAPDKAPDLLGAVWDDALLGNLVRRPEQSLHVYLQAKRNRLAGGCQ